MNSDNWGDWDAARATANWNPWHGCRKLSEGCRHCYVYRMDERYGRHGGEIYRTGDFYLPVRHARGGGYKLAPGTLVWTCFTSDFLLAEADVWRGEAWRMMRERADCRFLFITKRIDRLAACIPEDWGEGYPHVAICCTVENQARADERLPVFRDAPIRDKALVAEPLLGPLDLRPYLGPWLRGGVTVGGESGEEARPCRYEWVLDIRRQCAEAGLPFRFKQTGARFIKDGRLYRIRRSMQHEQARRANIDLP
ncbi:MAG: DUF5131 family protein [Clostridia bacterium]|nr:DUF5131 family protein [Clostridia bacterium]